MLQAQWTDGGIGLADVDPGPPRAGWVRLKVVASGICGSDLHHYRQRSPAPRGTVPGHEIVGTVADGPAALADGLYAVEPQVPCFECHQCISGYRNLCPDAKLIGWGEPGGLAEFVDLPPHTLHPIDPSLPPLTASIAEPMCCSYRAVRLARLDLDSRVLVLGAGSIGLLAGLLARDRAVEVAITARYAHQQEAARRLGLTPLAENDLEAWARDREPDVVIETVGGSADTIDQAIQAVQPAGRIVIVGIFTEPTKVDGLTLVLKEVDIVGASIYTVSRHGSEFGSTVAAIPRYRQELESLQTHQWPLPSINDAFACAADKSSGAIKVTVLPN